MLFELPIIVWILFLVGLALVAGYASGHREGFKEGKSVGYRRGAKSVSK